MVLILAALALAVLLWLCRPVPVRARAGGDPHAMELAEFRRDLSDWDRSGRP